mgnify:CR=1 FL=1
MANLRRGLAAAGVAGTALLPEIVELLKHLKGGPQVPLGPPQGPLPGPPAPEITAGANPREFAGFPTLGSAPFAPASPQLGPIIPEGVSSAVREAAQRPSASRERPRRRVGQSRPEFQGPLPDWRKRAPGSSLGGPRAPSSPSLRGPRAQPSERAPSVPGEEYPGQASQPASTLERFLRMIFEGRP